MAFQKFMNKKDFHPSSLKNIKLVWEAEQKQAEAERREKEMREQYEKEQEKYRTKQYIAGSGGSAKLSLNFMYDAPPGLRKPEKEDDDTEPKLELKFDWQKQIPQGKSAPRESYAKDLDIKDRPFGIEVRNVHCLKCGKWGHINTDKVCPMFGKSKEESFMPTQDPTLLMREMRRDGLSIKRHAMGRQVDPHANNQQMISSSEDEDDPEIAFLKSLNRKQKMKLLKKLDKEEGNDGGDAERPRKHKKKKKRRKRSDSSDGEGVWIEKSAAEGNSVKAQSPKASHRSRERSRSPKRRKSRSRSRSPQRRRRRRDEDNHGGHKRRH